MVDFPYAAIPREAENWRARIRTFLDAESAHITPQSRAQTWMAYDAEFSRKLGAAGFIGVSAPRHLGGQDAGAFARFVVSEELLSAGAPVSAHWITDRQTVPLLLNFGTPEQQQLYIPPIVSGESFFCIGMSEPDSGSDLASISSRAERDGSGWRLNGRKVWTTNAHRSHYMCALVRSSRGESRHAGMSQFIIDMSAPGVTIRPIRDITGEEHFNEVFFDDVRLEANALVGTEGAGWSQVNAELAFERSGPERFLSSFTLLARLAARAGTDPEPLARYHIGRASARIAVLRQMSISVTAQLDAGEKPAWAAACVKDLGTSFEQELVETAQLLLGEPRMNGGDAAEEELARIVQLAPTFSLRGGTREILRGIIAGGLGVR